MWGVTNSLSMLCVWPSFGGFLKVFSRSTVLKVDLDVEGDAPGMARRRDTLSTPSIRVIQSKKLAHVIWRSLTGRRQGPWESEVRSFSRKRKYNVGLVFSQRSCSAGTLPLPGQTLRVTSSRLLQIRLVKPRVPSVPRTRIMASQLLESLLGANSSFPEQLLVPLAPSVSLNNNSSRGQARSLALLHPQLAPRVRLVRVLCAIHGSTNGSTNSIIIIGGFGNTANTSTSAFGAKPATTGFGAFGGGTTTGTSAFGSGTSAFGQPAAPATTTTSLFGQPAAQTAPSTSAFGGGGLFGQAKPATGFGASACSASSAIAAIGTDPTPATGAGTHPVVTTGTQNPPYAAHHEKDGTTTSQYQAITCMPAYAGYSFEVSISTLPSQLLTHDAQSGTPCPGLRSRA